DAMNTASRLQSGAEPGGVLIGEPTWRLVRSAVVGGGGDAPEATGQGATRGAGGAGGATGRQGQGRSPACLARYRDRSRGTPECDPVRRARARAAATRGGAGGRDRCQSEGAPHDSGSTRSGKVAARRGVCGRSCETGDGTRGADSLLRRGSDVRAACRTPRSGSRNTIRGRRGSCERAAGA